jgi:hypothetical protein
MCVYVCVGERERERERERDVGGEEGRGKKWEIEGKAENASDNLGNKGVLHPKPSLTWKQRCTAP